ncbi:MAG: hypothetical protein QS721_00800 [Candidatus Endonucleobacter sp. (ex Gigantidas childressi)]|nr:hypothetical protein [Candidatus Endonucleobacter sp. (ex Gigantidas childressi)]
MLSSFPLAGWGLDITHPNHPLLVGFWGLARWSPTLTFNGSWYS